MPEDPQIAEGTIVLGEDFESHRIIGYVPHAASRGWDPNLNVPLINFVDWARSPGKLYQGGCQDGVALPKGFNFVLSLYPWEKYVLPEGCDRLEVEMYDSLDQSVEQIDELSDLVVAKLNDAKTVLVHCQAGLNRSGLVTGVVLVKLGYTPVEAISLLRRQRSHLVLCNDTFENYVAGLA